jgi:hypothetical protein
MNQNDKSTGLKMAISTQRQALEKGKMIPNQSLLRKFSKMVIANSGISAFRKPTLQATQWISKFPKRLSRMKLHDPGKRPKHR